MVRKGEIGRRQIKRQWPHRVELPAEAVRGTESSAAPYPLSDFHDDPDFAVFHFKTAEDAQAFHDRFGGELLPVEPPRGGRRR